MPRPMKCRRVCAIPQCRTFTAKGGGGAHTLLALDELEALRLADLEDLDQEVAAKRIGVSRGTFQRMLYSARKKVADALVNGWGIRIDGGNFELAQGRCSSGQRCGACPFTQQPRNKGALRQITPKGGLMILAVTTEGENVFQHFGQCSSFTIMEIENGKIKSRKLLKLDTGGHGMNASFLKASKVETLLCGGIGQGAQELLKDQGIQIVAGIEGKIDDAVTKYLDGSLKTANGPTCSNHEHEHGHSCSCSSKK